MMRKRPLTTLGCATVLLFAILAAPFLLFSFVKHAATKQTAQITIEEKWIKAVGEGSQAYMVATEAEVFTVRDNLWEREFRAADLYAKLQPGNTVCVSMSGWRIGFFSSYKGIYRLEDPGKCA
jgi:hypothetical protein